MAADHFETYNVGILTCKAHNRMHIVSRSSGKLKKILLVKHLYVTKSVDVNDLIRSVCANVLIRSVIEALPITSRYQVCCTRAIYYYGPHKCHMFPVS